jgi:hypothetical protein
LRDKRKKTLGEFFQSSNWCLGPKIILNMRVLRKQFM